MNKCEEAFKKWYSLERCKNCCSKSNEDCFDECSLSDSLSFRAGWEARENIETEKSCENCKYFEKDICLYCVGCGFCRPRFHNKDYCCKYFEVKNDKTK